MENKKGTYPGFTEARARANKKYLEKFVTLSIRVTPDRRGVIQAHAEAQGESVNAFVNRAIDEAMDRDAPSK